MVKLAKVALRRELAIVALLVFPGSIIFPCVAFSQPGLLEIHVKDHRDAIGDFAQLKIAIDQLSISSQAGWKFWRKDWQELSPALAVVDLTQYVGKRTALIYRGSIHAGRFDAFHLRLKSVEGLLRNDHVATVKNTIGPVALSFEVRPRSVTLLVIDLVVTDFSDHPPRGYELGMRGYELFANGKLITKVPPG